MSQKTAKKNAKRKPAKRTKKKNALAKKRGQKHSIVFIESSIDVIGLVLIAFTIGLIVWLISANKTEWVLYLLVVLFFEIVVMIILRVIKHYETELSKAKQIPTTHTRQITSERPELSVEKATVIFEGNKIPEIALIIVNRGKAGAHNIVTQGFYCVKPKSFAGYLGDCAYSAEDTYPHLAPGAAVSIMSMSGKTVSEETMADIKSGEQRFFSYAKISYKKTPNIKTGYNLSILFMYEPQWNNLRVAPPEFWAEKRKA